MHSPWVRINPHWRSSELIPTTAASERWITRSTVTHLATIGEASSLPRWTMFPWPVARIDSSTTRRPRSSACSWIDPLAGYGWGQPSWPNSSRSPEPKECSGCCWKLGPGSWTRSSDSGFDVARFGLSARCRRTGVPGEDAHRVAEPFSLTTMLAVIVVRDGIRSRWRRRDHLGVRRKGRARGFGHGRGVGRAATRNPPGDHVRGRRLPARCVGTAVGRSLHRRTDPRPARLSRRTGSRTTIGTRNCRGRSTRCA